MASTTDVEAKSKSFGLQVVLPSVYWQMSVLVLQRWTRVHPRLRRSCLDSSGDLVWIPQEILIGFLGRS